MKVELPWVLTNCHRDVIDSVVQHGLAGQYSEVEKSDVQIEMDHKQIIKLHYCFVDNTDGTRRIVFSRNL